MNQSFVFTTGTDTAEQQEVEQDYDAYAAKFNTLFISGAGNGGAVLAPGSAYNGIGVGAYGGTSSTGPTYDGRSKPDITAPADATSYSTPQVSGAAAILLQAALRGDAGAGTASDAADARTLKALLFNGAVKPADWATGGPTQPLDPRYGAGILNVNNSYLNLKAGEVVVSGSLSGAAQVASGGTYLPQEEGWELTSIANPKIGLQYLTETNYYEFDLPATAESFTLTSTLTWWWQTYVKNHVTYSGINNLDLYLFDMDTNRRTALSNSSVDNVEQIYQTGLLPGRYELEVVKNGGSALGSAGLVSQADTYALAFDFEAVPEPPTWLLLGLGAPFAMAHRRGRNRSAD